MNAIRDFRIAAFSLGLLATLAPAHADIQVLISVKFIHNNDAGSTRPGSTLPGGGIGTVAGFDAEIIRGNAILDATSRGFSVTAVEYIDIQPPAPAGAPANVTGGTTSGLPTVTCGNTSGLQNFMRVQGAGIPANTVILSFNPNTSFTMSNNATATNPSVAIAASFPTDHWFNIPARATRQYIETTALASQAVWRWNPGAINLYVNNSSSGQCSFVGSGSSVSFGASVGAGTVLHELGHIFNLQHTHALDYPTNTNPPTETPPRAFAMSDLMDGDMLTETVNDNPNISTNDQLSVALFGVPYNQPPSPPNAPFANAAQRAAVDSTYENVMSYHNENVLLSVQMDLWTLNANAGRLGFCTGRTWFVANGGNDGAAGNTAAVPLATVTSGLSHVSTTDDVVLLRNGSYAAPASGTISTVCTLRATRGEATIHFP